MVFMLTTHLRCAEAVIEAAGEQHSSWLALAWRALSSGADNAVSAEPSTTARCQAGTSQQ